MRCLPGWRALSLALSPAVPALHFRGHDFLWPPFATGELHSCDLAGVVADQACSFAVTAMAGGHGDAAAVAAGDVDFRGIQKRIESVGIAGQHDVAHRNEIEGAP